MKNLYLIITLFAVFALAACGSVSEPAADAIAQAPLMVEAMDLKDAESAADSEAEESLSIPEVEEDQPADPEEIQPAVTPTAETPLDLSLPLTPPQGEGPFYPVEKPADRDNNLVVVEGLSSLPEGSILTLSGRLLRTDGTPIGGAVIEIWQTDNNGVYLHPNDPGIANRDPAFQSYGEAVTAADGNYAFVTLLPNIYGNRPRHIHVKVVQDGREQLTTQFYFAGDERLQSDGLVASAGEDLSLLLVDMSEGVDENGRPVLVGVRDIVLP